MPHAHFSETEKTALRTWLKLLGTSNQIRKQLQARLQKTHGISLSRFDVLANLYRAPAGGMRLSHLSDQLMVSNGNVTQVMAPLVKDGFVLRQVSKQDARVATAQLTEKGSTRFEAMATDHARWVAELLKDISEADQQSITRILSHVTLEEE